MWLLLKLKTSISAITNIATFLSCIKYFDYCWAVLSLKNTGIGVQTRPGESPAVQHGSGVRRSSLHPIDGTTLPAVTAVASTVIHLLLSSRWIHRLTLRATGAVEVYGS